MSEKKPPTARQLAGRQRAGETAKKKAELRQALFERLVLATQVKATAFEQVRLVLADYDRTLNPPAQKSRPERWADAASAAEAALADLVDIQQEFSDWKDNLSENLQNSPVGEKLEEICKIDLESAKSSVEEAAGADVPLGFGRG